ncbi:hypothetical protein WJX79_008527 [Trebouxia sp. C0005]
MPGLTLLGGHTSCVRLQMTCLVIELVAEHPELQLASLALPGLPSDVKGYVSHVETVVSGVRFIADAWDSAIRLDDLNPLDNEVLQLWGSILSCLDAFTAARELLDLTHCALDHHPRTAHNYIARAKVEDWTYQQSCHLPRRGIFMPGHDPDRRLSLEDYRLLCNNQLGVKAHGTRVNRMVKQTFTKWCDAFGRHTGLEMPQVAHLVEEAVQAQVVLMSENRRDIHRDAKAGPDFGSVVYGSTQQALAFTPPADPLSACAAVSGKGASFASGAFQTGSTPSGSAPPNRPFTRQGMLDTTPRARPQNRGVRRPYSRAGTAGPSEETSHTTSSTQANKWSTAQAQDLIASDIGLRSLNKLKSAHGGLYMGVHYAQQNFYLVLGTATRPVISPKGVVVNDDPKDAWASLSISCDDSILEAIMSIDERMREVLADNSEALFGMKCTPQIVEKYKFYTPLAYGKEESSLPPLAGGKVLPSTIVEDNIGHTMIKTPSILKHLSEVVPAGSKINALLNISSLYFQG